MFDQYYKQLSDAFKMVPKYIEDDYRCVADKYDKKVYEIKHMHEMYSK